MLIKVKTPCIGVCSTGIGDSVCRGCKRFAHEVINWNAYSEQERAAIMARIESLLTQVIKARIDICDQEKLEAELQAQSVRVHPELNPYCQAYEALRAFGAKLPSLDAIGCSLRLEYKQLNLSALKKDIEHNFYELSRAHYERFFPGHM